jgi:hypothetical protein
MGQHRPNTGARSSRRPRMPGLARADARNRRNGAAKRWRSASPARHGADRPAPPRHPARGPRSIILRRDPHLPGRQSAPSTRSAARPRDPSIRSPSARVGGHRHSVQSRSAVTDRDARRRRAWRSACRRAAARRQGVLVDHRLQVTGVEPQEECRSNRRPKRRALDRQVAAAVEAARLRSAPAGSASAWRPRPVSDQDRLVGVRLLPAASRDEIERCPPACARSRSALLRRLRPAKAATIRAPSEVRSGCVICVSWRLLGNASHDRTEQLASRLPISSHAR